MKNTNNTIKELTDFLDKYGAKYKVVGDIVKAGKVVLNFWGIKSLPDNFGDLKCNRLYLSYNELTSLPDSIGNLKCKELWLDNNKLTSLPDNFGDLKCRALYLYNNKFTLESVELLEKLKSNGVIVID